MPIQVIFLCVLDILRKKSWLKARVNKQQWLDLNYHMQFQRIVIHKTDKLDYLRIMIFGHSDEKIEK